MRQPVGEMDAPNGAVGQVTVTVVDGNGARSTAQCALMEFEQSEHGAILGRLVIPWQRIQRVSWDLPPRDPDLDETPAKVRVVVDDGTAEGEEIVVPSDRFEVIAWAVGLLVDERADTYSGMIEQRRILVPWHAVREYERLATGVMSESREGLLPIRPDA
jgi:hypothetical protein